jgi:transcriptional regulator with XRE-family HTH domain
LAKRTSRFREWRERKGLRLDEVADVLGISVSYLSRIERGQRALGPLDQIKVARVLGTGVKDLFQREPVLR